MRTLNPMKAIKAIKSNRSACKSIAANNDRMRTEIAAIRNEMDTLLADQAKAFEQTIDKGMERTRNDMMDVEGGLIWLQAQVAFVAAEMGIAFDDNGNQYDIPRTESDGKDYYNNFND